MCDRPLIAPLPKHLSYGDEIILKGKVRDDATEISFNFVLDSCPQPSMIAYHFKTKFKENVVVHNTKQCTWLEEKPEENTWIDKPGEEFILTFYFDDSEILIYTGDDMRDLQYRYDHVLAYDEIKSVQVWGDVEYITEVTFRYRPDV
uniref:Galectin n=1 Tax=Tabanus bromius TaxID=304241 RepID=A0A0K8TTR1_TABBR